MLYANVGILAIVNIGRQNKSKI